MYAILLRGNTVCGYVQTTEDEAAEIEYDHDLVEELPSIIETPSPVGYIIKRAGFNDYFLEALTAAPKSEIELLKEENADLKSRISDIELAFADIISGGGI